MTHQDPHPAPSQPPADLQAAMKRLESRLVGYGSAVVAEMNADLAMVRAALAVPGPAALAWDLKFEDGEFTIRARFDLKKIPFLWPYADGVWIPVQQIGSPHRDPEPTDSTPKPRPKRKDLI